MSTKFLRQIPATLGMSYIYVLSDLKFRWLRPHIWKAGITEKDVSERKANIEASILAPNRQKKNCYQFYFFTCLG
jgi:hypothetical protein